MPTLKMDQAEESPTSLVPLPEHWELPALLPPHLSQAPARPASKAVAASEEPAPQPSGQGHAAARRRGAAKLLFPDPSEQGPTMGAAAASRRRRQQREPQPGQQGRRPVVPEWPSSVPQQQSGLTARRWQEQRQQRPGTEDTQALHPAGQGHDLEQHALRPGRATRRRRPAGGSAGSASRTAPSEMLPHPASAGVRRGTDGHQLPGRPCGRQVQPRPARRQQPRRPTEPETTTRTRGPWAAQREPGGEKECS